MVAVWLPPPQWLFENAPIQSHSFPSPPEGREKSLRRGMAIPPWGSRARGGGSLA